MRSSWCLAILASAVLPFAAGLAFEHVYDDRSTLVDHPLLDRPLGELLGILARGGEYPDASRPGMVLSAWLDHRLWASAPWGTHLTSLILYAACAIATFHLAFVVSASRRTALLASCAWAALPIHTECVVGASYREDLFAYLGVVACLGIVLRPRTTPATTRDATAAALWVSLGLAGKESAVTVLPLLVACAPWSRSFWAKRMRFIEALALVLMIYAAWRFDLAREGDGIPRATASDDPLPQLVTYFGWVVETSFVPLTPRPIHMPLTWGAGHVGAVLALAILFARTRDLRRRRAIAIVILGGLATSPLVGPINATADRYLLFSTLGVSLLYADPLQRWARTGGRLAKTVPVVTMIALGALAARESLAWSRDRVLFEVATERAPESPKAWQARSVAERHEGDLAAARRSLARSLALDPARPPSRMTEVYLQMAEGDVAAARRSLEALDRDGFRTLQGFSRAEWCLALRDPRQCDDLAPP